MYNSENNMIISIMFNYSATIDDKILANWQMNVQMDERCIHHQTMHLYMESWIYGQKYASPLLAADLDLHLHWPKYILRSFLEMEVLLKETCNK